MKSMLYLIALLSLVSCFKGKEKQTHCFSSDKSICPGTSVNQDATEVVYSRKEFNEALHHCTHDEDRFMYVKTFEMSVCSEHVESLKQKGLLKSINDFEKISKAQANMLKELEKTSKDLSNGREECSDELKSEYLDLLRNNDAGNPLIDRLERKAFNPINCKISWGNSESYKLDTNVIGRLIRQAEKKEMSPKLKLQSAMMGEHFTSPTLLVKNSICGEYVRKFNEFNRVLIEKSGLTVEDLQEVEGWLLGMKKMTKGMKVKAPDCEIVDPFNPTVFFRINDIESLLNNIDLTKFEMICRAEIWSSVSHRISGPDHFFSRDTVQANLLREYPENECLKVGLIDFINGDLDESILLKIWED